MFSVKLSDKMHFDKYLLTALKEQKLKESYLFRDPEIFDSFSCCHLGYLGIWPYLDSWHMQDTPLRPNPAPMPSLLRIVQWGLCNPRPVKSGKECDPEPKRYQGWDGALLLFALRLGNLRGQSALKGAGIEPLTGSGSKYSSALSLCLCQPPEACFMLLLRVDSDLLLSHFLSHFQLHPPLKAES